MDAKERLQELRLTWKAPRELDRCCPRRIRLTASGRAVLALALFFFGGGIALTVVLYAKASTDHEERRLLEQDGIVGEARITRRWVRRGDKQKYFIGYTWLDEGREFEGQTQVGRRSYARYAPGAPIRVRYLPGDPRKHLVIGLEDTLLPFWVPFALGLALVGGGCLTLLALHKPRRLLSGGRAAPGIVTSVVNEHKQKVAQYTFIRLCGTTVDGKYTFGTTPPEPGSIICVVYERDRPRSHAVYPFSLVRCEK